MAPLTGKFRGRALKDEYLEERQFRARSLVGFLVIFAVLLVLASRFYYLQWVRHDDFATRSTENRVRITPLPPNRGLIYDRQGRLLADNRPAYRLEIVPERVEDMDALLLRLSELVSLSEDQLARFRRQLDHHQHFQGVPLKFSLEEDELARFAVNQHRLPGARVMPYLSRHYPHGELLTHVVGYVGRIDEDDLRQLDETNYRGTDHVGKTGVEQFRETELHGMTGVAQVETNVQGRVLDTLSRTDPVPGQDLVLTIDLELQRAAWEALGENFGSVVAIDPQNGDVLAMVSKPSFDPNWFVNGVSQQRYDGILATPGRPLFNRALRGSYEPGSTFKPFVALAGLETGLVSPETRVYSSGEYRLPNVSRPWRDWRRGGHGWVTVREALEQSVNTYFYQLAVDIGIDPLHDYLAQFGFGEPSGVDLPGESGGVLPSRAWKRAQLNQPWYPGETVISGIGQGFNVVTPLQLASATATLAARGQRYRPRLVQALRDPLSGGETPLPPQTLAPVPVHSEANWNAVDAGMLAVMHGERGTARQAARGAPYRIAGKTGTAQLFGLAAGQEYKADEVAANLRHNALFVAFAPAESPRIAIAVVAEHGGAGSSVAAPVARAVLDAWLLPQGEQPATATAAGSR